MPYNAKIVINYNQAGCPALNILAGRIEDNVTPAAAAERVFFAAQNSYMSRLAQALLLESVTVQSFDDPSEGTYVPAAPVSGANGPNAAPVNVAIVGSKTITATRRKGRMFLPGVPEGAVDSSRNVSAGEVALVTEQLENFRTICAVNETSDGTPANQPGEDVLLGVYSLNDPLPGSNTFRSILQFQALSRIGSQSRRRDN